METCWNMDRTEYGYRANHTHTEDKHGNISAHEGCDRCTCGTKYWESDHCIDCGRSIQSVWVSRYGQSASHMAQTQVSWAVDRAKMAYGMVRDFDSSVDADGTGRFVPMGGGMGRIVVDA